MHIKKWRSGADLRSLVSALTMTCALCAPIGTAQAANATLRWGVVMDIPGLDPVYQGNNWEYASAINLYDSLVWPDAEKGVKPWVAESWQVSDDAKTYTFKIRKGLQFHDGSELTAEDVAFSMTRMLTLNGPAAANFRTLKADGVKLVDAGTVSFTLAVPDSAFVKALLTFKIVNKKLVLANLADGTYGEFKDYGKAFLQHNDAGSGPYKVSVHKPGELLRMVRFDAYSLTPGIPMRPPPWSFRSPLKWQPWAPSCGPRKSTSATGRFRSPYSARLLRMAGSDRRKMRSLPPGSW